MFSVKQLAKVAWYEHGQHCSAATQRLRLCTVILAQKQNKTKLGEVMLKVQTER